VHHCGGDDSDPLNGFVPSGTHPNRRLCHCTIHRLARRQMHLGFEPHSNRSEKLAELSTPLLHRTSATRGNSLDIIDRVIALTATSDAVLSFSGSVDAATLGIGDWESLAVAWRA
jgi:hypothetical protein